MAQPDRPHMTIWCTCIAGWIPKATYIYSEYKTFISFPLQRVTRTHLSSHYTLSDNKVRELITVKLLHTSLLNTTVVTFKVLPLGSYAPMPVPSPPFQTILKLVLWNGLQSCHCITPDIINVIKMPSFKYFIYLQEQKKVTGG